MSIHNSKDYFTEDRRTLKKVNDNQIMYTIVFLIITLKGLLSSSYLFWGVLNYIDSFLTIIALAFILLKVFFQKFHRKELILWMVVGLCCVITSFLMKDFYLANTFLLIFSMKNVNIEKVLKSHLIFVGTFLAIHVICFGFMWWYNKSAIPYTYRNGVLRYGFYMIHPNNFSMYLTWTSLEWLYLYIEKAKKRHILVLIVINLFCYYFTDSRSSLIIFIVAIILLLFARQYEFKQLKQIIAAIAKYGFAFGTVVYAIMSFTYTHVRGILLILYRIFDTLISTRLTLATYVADVYGISIIGRQVTSRGKIYWNGIWFDVIYLDSAYTALLFGYGVIYSIIFIILFYYTAKKVSLKKQIFILLYILYSFMENYGLNASSCFVPLFIGEVLYQRNQNQEKVIIDSHNSENKNEDIGR